jgi:transcriptional regulator with GAF, ATPase, and Fis domain
MDRIACWLHAWGETSEQDRDNLIQSLARHGVSAEPFQRDSARLGVCIFDSTTPELRAFLQTASRLGQLRVIAVAGSGASLVGPAHWNLLQAGAADVLLGEDPDLVARQIRSRFERWLYVEQLMEEPSVSEFVVAKSPIWRMILRDIIEIARFSEASVLILGETGTGKEIVARLIHMLDSRRNKRELVILDCTTVVPELSGSEFFGHEKGAFTGALTERHGAFALANGGTLFLDEIGDLPLPLQAQLLRVVQEHTYKRLGGSTWRTTEFRLLCATNRDLSDLVSRGAFRADLYYRIAGFITKLPPLRERREDIIPLAEHFLHEACPEGPPLQLDEAVRDYLLRREYPGNVRDLQQLVLRFTYHHVGDRTISVGCVPPDERPVLDLPKTAWQDLDFETPVRRAVLLGARLKEIGRAAEDAAIRYVTDEEHGNLQRAARRLGVTDRALQLRRANGRQIEKAAPGNLCVREALERGSRYASAAQAQAAAVETLKELSSAPNAA